MRFSLLSASFPLSPFLLIKILSVPKITNRNRSKSQNTFVMFLRRSEKIERVKVSEWEVESKGQTCFRRRAAILFSSSSLSPNSLLERDCAGEGEGTEEEEEEGLAEDSVHELRWRRSLIPLDCDTESIKMKWSEGELRETVWMSQCVWILFSCVSLSLVCSEFSQTYLQSLSPILQNVSWSILLKETKLMYRFFTPIVTHRAMVVTSGNLDCPTIRL